MKNIIIILNIIIFSLVSCQNHDNKNNKNAETIKIDLYNIYKPNFKEIFSSIEICPLETNDNSLIGKLFLSKKAIIVPDKYYIIIDSKYHINIFDTNGKFISNSSKLIGEGPNKYTILQDITYNQNNKTIDILDPFGYIISYDTNFNFISKKEIKCKTKDRFRRIDALDKSTYALFDSEEKSYCYIYDNKKNKLIKKIEYPGLIANLSSVIYPFNYSNNDFYFIPPEINNYIFKYNSKEVKLAPLYYIDGGKYSISNADLKDKSDLKEISEFIAKDCNKYSPINRLYSKNHIITTYLKKGEIFINICNINKNNNMTFYKNKELKNNLPFFLYIDKNSLFAILDPIDINNFIDKDITINKDIIESLKEDDNPCIIKYNLKF